MPPPGDEPGRPLKGRVVGAARPERLPFGPKRLKRGGALDQLGRERRSVDRRGGEMGGHREPRSERLVNARPGSRFAAMPGCPRRSAGTGTRLCRTSRPRASPEATHELSSRALRRPHGILQHRIQGNAMDRPTQSRPARYFEEIYARDPDPWNFTTSAYERAKYEATMTALPKPRYARGFEVGCSIGVLTRMLAARCDELLSVDAAETPLQEARKRCADLAEVRFARMRLPDEAPDA